MHGYKLSFIGILCGNIACTILSPTRIATLPVGHPYIKRCESLPPSIEEYFYHPESYRKRQQPWSRETWTAYLDSEKHSDLYYPSPGQIASKQYGWKLDLHFDASKYGEYGPNWLIEVRNGLDNPFGHDFVRFLLIEKTTGRIVRWVEVRENFHFVDSIVDDTKTKLYYSAHIAGEVREIYEFPLTNE